MTVYGGGPAGSVPGGRGRRARGGRRLGLAGLGADSTARDGAACWWRLEYMSAGGWGHELMRAGEA